MPEYAHGYDKMTDQQLLEKVEKGWLCDETPCGTGSTVSNSALIRTKLPRIALKYGIETVSDAGAGDLNWMPLVKWDVAYQGFDLYPRHESVIQFDMTKEVLPKSDLIICRHVLNHLSIQYAERALENFRKSGSTYLLMTNCENQSQYWAHYKLQMPAPVEVFKDCQHWWLELYELDSLPA